MQDPAGTPHERTDTAEIFYYGAGTYDASLTAALRHGAKYGYHFAPPQQRNGWTILVHDSERVRAMVIAHPAARCAAFIQLHQPEAITPATVAAARYMLRLIHEARASKARLN